GFFKEIVGSTKQYACKYTVSESINDSTNFLTVALFTTDEYYLLLDNPEKNINTKFDLKTIFSGINLAVERINDIAVGTFFLGFYNFRDILEFIINELDPTITINSNTYTIFDNNNYDNILISSLDDYRKSTTASLEEVTEINLKRILDFLSFNSGLNFYYYLDSSNNLVFDKISNLTQGAYVLDLTNYNGSNWASQKQDITTFEEKFSLISYLNISSFSYFRNIDCVFSKNAKNESINQYNFIVDIDQYDVSVIPTAEKKGGDVIVNCDLIQVNLQTEQWNNSGGSEPLDTFSSNGTGTTLTGTNTSGGYQFAERDIFAASKGQQIVLDWNILNVGSGRLIEIWESGGSQVASFDLNDGEGAFVIPVNGNYYFRISLSVNPSEFDISNFSITIDNLIVRSSVVELKYTNNYELSPNYI
ncbi:unnamed protein product, partial [marine sediment metagenome]